jgi:hypothetical protein
MSLSFIIFNKFYIFYIWKIRKWGLVQARAKNLIKLLKKLINRKPSLKTNQPKRTSTKVLLRPSFLAHTADPDL